MVTTVSVSSSSGITSTSAKDVWRRWFWSKGEMRTSRWTPCSERSRPKARGPLISRVTPLRPAWSPGVISSTSDLKRWFSAHLMYIRISISVQSWESTPPAPGLIESSALWFA